MLPIPEFTVEFLLDQADKKKNNIYEARSWLLTARCLYPDNFLVYYHSYVFEEEQVFIKKSCTDDDESGLVCAKFTLRGENPVQSVEELLKHMMDTFYVEQQLWDLLKQLFEAMSDVKSNVKSTSSKLFEKFSPEAQKKILLMLANEKNEFTTCMERSSALLEAVRRFPALIPHHGVNLIDSLLASEKSEGSNPLHPSRKNLVCDVLPVVLSHSTPESLSSLHKAVYKWLQKSIEYYLALIVKTAEQKTEKAQIPGTPTLGLSTPQPNEVESEYWQQLLKLLTQFGIILGWKVSAMNTSHPINTESLWQAISTIQHKLNEKSASAGLQRQLVHITLLGKLFSCYNYWKLTDSNLLLLPPVESLDLKDPTVKKLKTEFKEPPNFTFSPSICTSVCQAIKSNFTLAWRCDELLSSDSLSKDVKKLTERWIAGKNFPGMQKFQFDKSLCNGAFKQVYDTLHSNESALDMNQKVLYVTLSCRISQSSEMSSVLKVLNELPSDVTSVADASKVLQGWSSELYFIRCTTGEVGICLTELVRQTAMKQQHTASSLGLTLLLQQLCWPRGERAVLSIIAEAKRLGSLSCPQELLSNYLHQPEVIELLAMINAHEADQISLQLLSASPTKARTVTRGVNKESQSANKSLLVSLMSKSKPDMVDQKLLHMLYHDSKLILDSL